MDDDKPKPYISLTDHIIDLLPDDPEILEQMVEAGYIFHPYIPLQVTRIILDGYK